MYWGSSSVHTSFSTVRSAPEAFVSVTTTVYLLSGARPEKTADEGGGEPYWGATPPSLIEACALTMSASAGMFHVALMLVPSALALTLNLGTLPALGVPEADVADETTLVASTAVAVWQKNRVTGVLEAPSPPMTSPSSTSSPAAHAASERA